MMLPPARQFLDPDLVAEAKRINVDILPTAGGELQRLIGELYATPSDIVEKARAAMVFKP